MFEDLKRSIALGVAMLATWACLPPAVTAGTGMSLKGDVAIGKDTATRALDVVGKGAFLDTPENNHPYHQLIAVGERGAYFEATGAGSGSTSNYSNTLASSPGTVCALIGDATPVTSQTQDNQSFGNIRFAATGKIYGDLGLYPLSDPAGNGLFRFSCAGATIDPEPNARVGVGSLAVTGKTRTAGGNVSEPTHALDVRGNVDISFGELTFNLYDNGHTGKIYADLNTGDLYAKNYTQTVAHQLTSHRDPREFHPEAKTSFGDPAVEIPFSIHHQVDALGKGAVVDMSKMVAYIEKKMKEELGEEAGRLVYVYALPTPPDAALKKRETEMARHQVEAILARLGQAPWIKVELGEGRKIPAEAVEEVPELKKVTRTAWVEREELDLDRMAVRRAGREETVTEMIPTGRKVRRLKTGWTFREGALYRRPTLEDIDLDRMLAAEPALPRWVLERLEAGRQVGMGLEEFKQQVTAALQERLREEGAGEAALAGGGE